MNLVARVKGLLIDPKAEWRIVEGEPGDSSALMKSYVAILAAIPSVCSFIGTSIVGIGPYRTGIVPGLASAIGSYILSLIGVFIVAFVIDALAEKFAGRKNFASAFKVAAYAPTAAWIASAFTAIPVLSFFSVLGLYSLYLFYTGLPILMKVPEDTLLGYMLVVLVCVVIVWAVILFLPARLLGVV